MISVYIIFFITPTRRTQLRWAEKKQRRKSVLNARRLRRLLPESNVVNCNIIKKVWCSKSMAKAPNRKWPFWRMMLNNNQLMFRRLVRFFNVQLANLKLGTRLYFDGQSIPADFPGSTPRGSWFWEALYARPRHFGRQWDQNPKCHHAAMAEEPFCVSQPFEVSKPIPNAVQIPMEKRAIRNP